MKLAPSNLSKMSLSTHALNFGIGPAFSKGPGSTFSEVPGPRPGPLYKVCWNIPPGKIYINENGLI